MTPRTRQCPVDAACAPVRGWEAFLDHIYQQHTAGEEQARWDAVQSHLGRPRPPTPSGIVPKVTAFPETAVLYALLQGDLGRARKLTGSLSPAERAEAERRLLAALGLLLRVGSPAVCRNCPHPVNLHDREGCTVTIPQTEDPDFGPTQTCPCCVRGEGERT